MDHSSELSSSKNIANTRLLSDNRVVVVYENSWSKEHNSGCETSKFDLSWTHGATTATLAFNVIISSQVDFESQAASTSCNDQEVVKRQKLYVIDDNSDPRFAECLEFSRDVTDIEVSIPSEEEMKMEVPDGFESLDLVVRLRNSLMDVD